MNSGEEMPFGPGYIMAGSLTDEELNFRFEVWARTPVPPRVVDQLYSIWRRARRTNVPKRNGVVRFQYLS